MQTSNLVKYFFLFLEETVLFVLLCVLFPNYILYFVCCFLLNYFLWFDILLFVLYITQSHTLWGKWLYKSWNTGNLETSEGVRQLRNRTNKQIRQPLVGFRIFMHVSWNWNYWSVPIILVIRYEMFIVWIISKVFPKVIRYRLFIIRLR